MPGYAGACFLFLFSLVTLTDAMRSLDVFQSRDSGSLTCTFPVSVSRDSYCTCMCHGNPPRPLSLSCLCFLTYASYSSPVMPTRPSRTSLRPYVIRMIRLPVLLAPSSLPNDFTVYSLTRLDAISVLHFYALYACLYLYRTDLYIYRVGDGSLPIFNLLCNHPSVVT